MANLEYSLLSTGEARTFRKIKNLRRYYDERSNLAEDGFFLLTTNFICQRWGISARTLERHLLSLRKKGFVDVERRGEMGRRHVRVHEMPAVLAEAKKRMPELPFPTLSAEHAERHTPAFQLQLREQWVATGTDGHCYVYSANGEVHYGGTAAPANLAELGGTVAAPMAVRMAEPHIIIKDQILEDRDPFHSKGKEGIPPKNSEMENKTAYTSQDPVLDACRAHSPAQTADLAASETAYAVELFRCDHLRRLVDFNVFAFKAAFRRARTDYDRKKRNVVGEFYGFFGEHLRLFYQVLDKCAAHLEKVAGQPPAEAELLAFFERFVAMSSSTQRTFTPLFLRDNFELLLEVAEQVVTSEREKDGVNRDPARYRSLGKVPGGIEALDQFVQVFDHYADMRKQANLNLNTEEFEWNAKQKNWLLKFVDELATTYAATLTKSNWDLEQLLILTNKLLRYWLHFPKFSPYYFAHELPGAIEIAKSVANNKPQPHNAARAGERSLAGLVAKLKTT